MKIITASEIIFRIVETIRFILERMQTRNPAPQLDPGPADSISIMPVILFNSISHPDQTRNLWIDLFNSERDIIKLADDILGNRIPIFSELIECGEPIDWHRECITGKRAPIRFYRDLDPLDYKLYGDVKQIWELNRHNYFIILGKAYWLTGELDYYCKWKNLIRSWMLENPYNKGVNWHSSLELAIRSINWIWASYFFRNELEKDNLLQKELLEGLYLHGKHIFQHLSYYFSPNTHLTGEALGLLYIGKAYPKLKEASKWVETALDILESQLDEQILDDGGYFERATYYHKYTVDIYLHFLILGGNNGWWNEETARKIRSMVRHLMLLADHDGAIPLIGDSDGGQLLFLDQRKKNVKGACCTAATLLDDGLLKNLCGSSYQEEALWLLGPTGLEAFLALQEIRPDNYHSINKQTGWYCFRSGIKDRDSYLIIDGGPHGWGKCGHAHADMLSYIWNDNGTIVLDDPGTYTYAGSERRHSGYRSSQRHNTIAINDLSQSIPGEAFKWKKIAKPRYSFAAYDGNFGYFEGENNAYDNAGCFHKRMVLFFGNTMSLVIDYISARKPIKSISNYFHFAPGKIKKVGEGIYSYSAEDAEEEHYLRFLNAKAFDMELGSGEVYPDYGKVVSAPLLKMVAQDFSGEHMIVTILTNEAKLAESFKLEGSYIAGDFSGSDYEISVRGSCNLAENNIIPIMLSAYASNENESLYVLRNSPTVNEAEGQRRLEVSGGCDYLSARFVDRELRICSDHRLDAVYIPKVVDRVTVNGVRVEFAALNGWLRFGNAQDEC